MVPKPEGLTKYGSLPKHYNYESLQVTGEEESNRFFSFSGKPVKKVVVVCIAVAAIAMVSVNMSRKHFVSDGGSVSPDAASSHPGDEVFLAPLSEKSPKEMGFITTERSGDTLPAVAWGAGLLKDANGNKKPLPTNIWYLNLLSSSAGEYSTESNKVYTVPYILDTVGPLTGLRVHWPVLQVATTNMQMVYDAENGLTMGTLDPSISKNYVLENEELSPLGLSLKWGDDESSMETHIVRGMPYATMNYTGVAPSFASGNEPASKPLIDGNHDLVCGTIDSHGTVVQSHTMRAESEVQLHFKNSDFTWVIFFSRPVTLACGVAQEAGPGEIADVMFQMNVVHFDHTESLVVRTALVDQCTSGKSNIKTHCAAKSDPQEKQEYLDMLREGAHLFPKTPTIDFGFQKSNKSNETQVVFDWNVQTSKSGVKQMTESDADLLMFALPHHQALLESSGQNSTSEVTSHCVGTFHGNTCLVKGSQWSLNETLGSPQSFAAKRPPEPSAIPALAEAVARDIKTQPSDNLYRGAADTYFSGKFLARLARIVVIASELKELSLSSESAFERYSVDKTSYSLAVKAAQKVDFPTNDEIDAAVENLKKAVEVWVNGEAEAAYVYDESWGGLVNCGCVYEGHDDRGFCNNTFPDCPALSDVNVDFGNGYYNDHHFHYGYHIYAAAVVAKYDPEWGREFFEELMLYVRDIANPSPRDAHFPVFRHKDWYLGSSWASGIVSANTPHGRNQESSSEAIAAYEAVTLFGQVMMDAFDDSGDIKGRKTAKLIRDAGQLLTETEIKAANTYWHVWNSTTHNNTYPPGYTQPVVGMLYETMASFQTWFAPEAFVSYGIQLLPLTPVAEERDDPEWASILYPKYNESCLAGYDFCEENGWTIVLAGLLATVGDRGEALEMALKIPDEVFLTDGGEGHSLTNTLWYIATRPDVTLGGNSTDG